jgi:threonine dehydratase
MNAASEVDRTSIAHIERLIRPRIRRTPVVEIDGADFGLDGVSLIFKLEFLQHAGSFKTRGAFANLLTRQVGPTGAVAASGGNHGAAVAYAAMRLLVPATIFVPGISSPAKMQRIRECGADLRIVGERYADALAASEEFAEKSGALPIHAFDQKETILGQGTIGVEWEAQCNDLDSVLVAVGGGGLISGIAAWYGRRARVIGVEPEASPTLTAALAAGHPVDAEAAGIAADSLAPRRVGNQVFEIARREVNGVVLVADDAIRRAQAMLWDKLRLVTEPGGAAAFAALLSDRYRPAFGERIGVLLSGGNTVAVNFD